MSEKTPFGPGFVCSGTLYDRKLNFRFEVWSEQKRLPKSVLEELYRIWRAESRKNRPKKNARIRLQYFGQ